ncbi:piezo-type mechanosensitive ion channel component isoform X3 [Stomoxys calcitrans]|uniref:piezo-type mechanosensitive ion channel component isoform X3 n=1 Tax=Stomoxys calcitrans TaxID=35570 RepID=UPI0027E2FE75|nr:piezo-type mechanosensitive ion channel component isoform X3 [Stomoxys calcitrans]
MAFSYACLTLQRVVLPIVLVLAALYRPVGISFVYLLMFFVSPFIPVATKQNFKGSVTAYFIILLALSTILLLCHIGLQVSIFALHIGDMFGTCTVTARLLRHIGFIAFQNLKAFAIVEWLAPEVVVFITSLVVYLISKKITQTVEPQLENGEGGEAIRENGGSGAGGVGENQTEEFVNAIVEDAQKQKHVVVASTAAVAAAAAADDNNKPNFDGLIKISPLFCLATLFFSAVLRPSVPGGFYFLIFLLSGSYWATFQTLQRKFAMLLRFVMVVIVAHTLCIVAYQTPWMQDHLEKTSLTARLIGLEPLVTSKCSEDIRIIVYNTEYKADSFLNPIVLFFTYYALALTTKNLIKIRIIAKQATAFGQDIDNSSTHKIQRQISLITQSSRSSKKDGNRIKTQRLNVTLRRDQQRPQIIIEPTETTPLMRATTRKPANDTNSSGAVMAQAASNDIPLSSMETNRNNREEEYKSGILDQIAYGITGVGGFIYQNSYIFTNVLMMAWSIIYHSWLTFVLLLWANVLWMIPNQRKAMMRSSLFIVIYAELLLIAQYIYGMDLTNDELPSKIYITGINLQQIGFERPKDNEMQPCVPLIVKTSFLLMFWVTMRQFFKEKTEKRRDSTLADMFAPLHLSVRSSGANDEGDAGADGKKTSKFLKKIGTVIKNLLVRLWIWLLILVIFLCAMTGDKMTGFRICYMALFLFFLLVFQSSSKAWVKLMYGFWLFLIFYAMSILILIYTYQFDKFDQYWNDYLNISKTLQTDIGLERYKTKDLLLHFISPTIIVILTVIQVHYFHKRFIASMNQTPMVEKPGPDNQQRQRTKSGSRPADYEIKDFTESAGELVRLFLRRFRQKAEKFLKHFKGVFWSILELHWIKVVYITAFACAVSEVSLLHVPFIVLCVIGVISNVRMRIFFSRVISLVVTLIVLSKMIYQIAYLDHTKYNAICVENGQSKVVGNNAEWFGLFKANSETGLMGLLKKYIIYMVVATLHAVISLRQYQMRRLKGTQNDPLPKVPFPEVTREDAEKKLESMIKYLLNYGFYKFGYEICMIALVSTITYRQDIVAVAYAVWLVLLLIFKRKKIAHFWGVFQIFILISIIVQYIILVQLPPTMCTKYIWEGSPFSESIQRWAMLPGHLKYDHTKKLIFDFILLLLVNRQKRVFSIENIPNFPGGSNQSVVKDIANLGKVEFVNPTHDFLSHMRNYLDIFKHAILCGFYWVTLAVVFLAGTSIADFLALGYLIGAFLFLWEGSDYYLRPIKSIINRWKILIAYNVANIVVKTCLQMAGCMFMDTLVTKCCWLVHILGINCASNGPPPADIDDNDGGCPATTVQVVLLWDSICFAFLIFQLRIFKSHYFCHIITDTRANNILASRGGEIIEHLRQKQIEKRQEYEEEVLHKIKRKMEKIRATQQKMLRPLEKPTHFDEHGNPVYGSRPHKRKEIKLHPAAVRAGDYYMFEDIDDKFELDLITDSDGLFDNDNENITESEIKMNRRKTLYDESQKPKLQKDTLIDTAGPSTSKAGETQGKAPEHRQRTEVDSGDLTEKDTEEDFEANPIIRLMEGFLVSLTIRLNRFSRNYRYVNKILEEEKKALKESNHLYMFNGRFSGRNAAAIFSLMKRNIASDDNREDAIRSTASATSSNRNSNSAPHNLINIQPQQQQTTNHQQNTFESNLQSPSQNPPTTTSTTTISTSPFDLQRQVASQPPPSQQQIHSDDINAIEPSSYDVVDSKETLSEPNSNKLVRPKGTELAFDEDDFTARDHNIIVEVLISAWYAILSNTDLICYIVVFINQIVNASLISLPLPLMIFLWGTLSLPRPTKTFWVTLIAYTQAIVLIKCIFQFKLIWANYHYNLPNNPLGIEKLFGVEMIPDYATYDLLLLLVLFFHRFILKSHGLWKIDNYKTVLFQSEGDEDRHSLNASNADGDANSMSERRRSVASDYASGSHESISATNELVRRVESFQRHKYLCGLSKFFHNLMHKARLPTDVYALMFLCDFINFFVLLFGFTAFSSKLSDGGVKTYLAENKVPVPFLIMLLVQFILIVIDRALYLRKALIFKIAFHFISVVGIHIWMFFVVPAVTERSFYASAPPIIFYIIKCFYLLLSSYQIKCGYPTRILGNFLTKSFSMINMISFKIYMVIPFLYELRTILDWLCTDTTMTLFDWLKMEDIFANIYSIKCLRQMETDFPAVRAQKKAAFMKLLMGGAVILFIVFLIWGPLTLFALFNAVGQSNVPTEVKVSLRISSYEPIYVTSTRESTYVFNDEMFSQMKNAYIKEREALSFLLNYDASDIAAIKLSGNSPTMWNIAPPDKMRLLDELNSNATLTVRLAYELTRTPPSKGQTGTVGSEITFQMNDTYAYRNILKAMINGTIDTSAMMNELAVMQQNETAAALNGTVAAVVNGTTVGLNETAALPNTTPVVLNTTSIKPEAIIPNVVPKFIKVLNSADPIYVSALLVDTNNNFRDLGIRVHTNNYSFQWWEIGDHCDKDEATDILKKLPLYDCNSGLVFYTFNDKKFPSTWTFITAGGIIGIYTTFVLVVSRFLKGFLGGQTRKIMYEDLPNVDRVLQLCLDIYLVREALEFMLEEDLFAKLLFLYRSPETMVKWTRPREEIADDETDTDSVRSRASGRREHPQQPQQQQLQQQNL